MHVVHMPNITLTVPVNCTMYANFFDLHSGYLHPQTDHITIQCSHACAYLCMLGARYAFEWFLHVVLQERDKTYLQCRKYVGTMCEWSSDNGTIYHWNLYYTKTHTHTRTFTNMYYLHSFSLSLCLSVSLSLSLSLSHTHTHTHTIYRIGFAIEEDQLQWNRPRNLLRKSPKEIYPQSLQFLTFQAYPPIWRQWDCLLHQRSLLNRWWWHHRHNPVHLICLVWAERWQLT